MTRLTPDPNPLNPEVVGPVKASAPPKSAAGTTAVLSSVGHVVGAMSVVRGVKVLRTLNQKTGFDCPGCAWPDPDGARSRLGEFCENGVKAIAEEATEKRIGERFFREHSVHALAELDDYQIGKQGRIVEPMYLPPNGTHYEPITWDAAFEKIGTHLNSLASPDEAVFYTSGRTSNEAAFLYQLFVREFGTNNLPDCSNMCHESSGVALKETLGTGKGTVTLEDFDHAEVILILGQNPGTNHPRMLTALERAKERGATIISVNPLREVGLMRFSNPQTMKGALGLSTELTDIFLPVKINGDLALILAIEALLLEADEAQGGQVFDHEFISAHTSGYAEFVRHLKGQKPFELSKSAGVSLELIRQTASVLTAKHRIIACWAMGLTQHKNSVATIQEVVNLLLLKGSLGKPGAGVCPVRGHSNVQGDRTMGIDEAPSAAFLDKLESVFQFKVPRRPGLDVVNSIQAMHTGQAKIFFAMGGNFLSATPDTLFTAEALRRCQLTVQVSTKLNRSHLVHGREALILPCLGRTERDLQNGEEQFVSCENSMSVVQMSQGNLNPASTQLLSEPAIVCRLAQATLGTRSKQDWAGYARSYDAIREAIAATIPGFDRYNERVRIPGGFYLTNAARELKFSSASGRAQFTCSPVTELKLAEGELLMMTIRSHDQFNTTIYGLDDRYRGIKNGRRVIFMNTRDIAAAHLNSGDTVDLHNHHGGKHRVARNFMVVAFDIPERCVATYFPETNVLVPLESTADKSNTPTSKTVVISITPTSGPS
ncbi:MAG: FdhF/YdeP family oxidoreductase [Polyangiaceae bacterium]|nr:FdhF/YdeP family oxidoreductase [Polyangiaceae bacterium]